MQRRILVSADDYEIRIAVIENSKLAEYFFERRNEERIIGNIYKGIVTSITPGIDAAFIDIGLPRNAFLYVNDLLPDIQDYDFLEDEVNDTEENGEAPAVKSMELPPVSIRDLLKEGQQILIQLYKEPIGAKGSRVTTNISLPGRYVVLLPCTRHVGVSRRIVEEAERERLKQIVTRLLPDHMGAIIRTAGKDLGEEAFREDLAHLQHEWERIKAKRETSPAPALLDENPSMVFLLIQDLISDGIEEIVVDDPSLYSEIVEFVKVQFPKSVHQITLYDDPASIFRAYGMETFINNLRTRKIWLHSGGYIVIDETEAMTVIDVNTGRYIGKYNLEETVFKTNLEAATEIARQIRLRDIGGIILIDFIDMRSKEHQEEMIRHFHEQLKKDRSRIHLYPLTELGLLQMTRKRVRKSFMKSITQPCPYCKREGHILSVDTMIIKIFRTFEEICREEGAKTVVLRVHPRLAEKITQDHMTRVQVLEERYNAKFKILPSAELHFEQIVEELG